MVTIHYTLPPSLTWKYQLILQSSVQRITVSEVSANIEGEIHHLMGSQAAAFIAYGTYVCQYKWSFELNCHSCWRTSLPIFGAKKKNLEQYNFFQNKGKFLSKGKNTCFFPHDYRVIGWERRYRPRFKGCDRHRCEWSFLILIGRNVCQAPTLTTHIQAWCKKLCVKKKLLVTRISYHATLSASLLSFFRQIPNIYQKYSFFT